MRLGILGLKNNDNGHPFSFSAIINGYNKSKFKKTRYKNILKYLDKKPQKDFGIKETDNVSSHGYDKIARNIVSKYSEGIVLDCGAGLRDKYYRNVVFPTFWGRVGLVF